MASADVGRRSGARDRRDVRPRSDIGLARLPRPAAIVVFGIDRPIYYSLHSS
jgi:hypothetical protein